VPFAALKVFFDPSVRYGLQFEDSEMSMRSQVASNGFDDDPAMAPAGRIPPKKPRTPRKAKSDREPAGNAAAENIAEVPRIPDSNLQKSGKSSNVTAAETPAAAVAETEDKTENPAGAQILSLDQFRKK
jgi:hypothetical protein